MSIKHSFFPTYSPGILSLLPLFYVGWADSILSPSEVKLIREKINQFEFLSKADKEILTQWSNPAKPPSEQLFKHWVKILKNQTHQMQGNKRKSLADLGLEMAKKSTPTENILYWSSSKTRNALEDLEKALGVSTLDLFKNISTSEQLKREIEEAFNTPSFDQTTMQLLLDGEHHQLRNRMRTLLSDPVFRYETIRDKDKYRLKILEWCKLLGDQGLGAWAFPSEYGGQNNIGEYTTIIEMLGYHDLSLTIKFGVQFGLFGGSVFSLGTKYHHDKYLSKIGTLELSGCFAMTETGHGSNVKGLETTATYHKENDVFIIHSPTPQSGKEYIGNALHGQMASVFAQLIVDGENHGVHALLVPYRDDDGKLYEGIRVEDCGYKLGLNGVDNGRLWFDHVRVPRQNLLNRFGNVDQNGKYTSPIQNPSKRFFTMLGTLVGGRVGIPKAGLSAAKSGLTIAIKYALKRRQFGPNIKEPETLLLDYPSHQKRLMPLLAKAYAINFSLNYLEKRYTSKSENDIREIETLAAGMKAYTTWFTTKTLQECREACGGKGYLSENRFADLKADTDIFTTFEGDNTVLMQLVAKGLLSDFNKAFHDEGFMAVIRFLSEQLSTSIAELNPIATRNTNTEHLLDSVFHLSAFQYRERKLLVSVAQRMRNLLKKRISPHNAFLKCQIQILSLANAYIERIVLEQFIKKIEACEDDLCQIMLKKLCTLYALDSIEQHKGFYLENDYMQGSKTKAIRRLVNKLCKEIRGEALFLVNAFAIPKECLAAEIIS